MLKRRDTYQYDGDGRLLRMQSYARLGNWAAQFYEEGRQQIQVTTEEREVQSTELGVLTATGWLAYTDANGNSGYDALGRVAVHRYGQTHSTESSTTGNSGLTVTYTHSYVGRDGWLEAGVSADAAEENYRDGNTAIAYDAWGRRTAQTETNPLPDYETTLTRKRFFSYDGGGQVLTRRDGTLDADTGAFEQTGNGSYGAGANPVPDFITQTQWEAMTTEQRQHWQGLDLNQRFVYVHGQQVARLSEAGDLAVSETLTAFDSSSTGTTETTVQDGDTLATIAQRVYGNSSLWYVLAEANAVTDGELFVGQSLKVPSVRTHRNDATTFQPYHPAETLGPTEPATPYIAPPPKAECDMLAAIVMVVIAVVVTVFTAGAASAFIGSQIAGAFIGGVAGSVASQLVGKELGVVDHFSLRTAVGSGIASALTAGIASASGLGTVSEALKAGSYLKAAGIAAMNATASYVGNKIAGVQDTSFSWKSIAASTVSQVVTAGIGNALGINPKWENGVLTTGNFGTDLANGAIGGVVSLHVRRAFGFDDEVNYGQIALDAFGNALGNMMRKSVDQRIQRKAADAERAALGEMETAFSVAEERAETMTKTGTLKQAVLDKGGSGTYAELVQEAVDQGLLTPEMLANAADAAASGGNPGGYLWPRMWEATANPELALGKNPNVLTESILYAIYANDKFNANLPILPLDASIAEVAYVNEVHLSPYANQINLGQVSVTGTSIMSFGEWANSQMAAFHDYVINNLDEAGELGGGNGVTVAAAIVRPLARAGLSAAQGIVGLGSLLDGNVRQQAYDTVGMAVSDPSRVWRAMQNYYRTHDAMDMLQDGFVVAYSGAMMGGAQPRLLNALNKMPVLGADVGAATSTAWRRVVSTLERPSAANAPERGVANKKVLSTGAREIPVEEYLRREATAIDRYAEIRVSTTDVSSIARNTGLPEFQVTRVKNHLFEAEHTFRDGSFARFDPDFDIAEAWARMDQGLHGPADLVLFKHEYFETRFERLYRVDYGRAHDAAQLRYPSPLDDF